MKVSEIKDLITKAIKEMSMVSDGTATATAGTGEQYFSKVRTKKAEDAPILAGGKLKNNYAVSHFGFTPAPSKPNRPSKAMDYKELWEDDDNSYMISKAGKKDNPHYILEKPDGSKQLDMFFSSPEEAKKYAEKKGIKISAQKGYNMEENIDKAEFVDSLDEAYTPSTTNVEELARVEELLAQANRDNAYSVMSSYEFRIKALRLLVALEKKYNTTLPLLKFGMMVNDYLTKYFPGFKGKFGPYNQNWRSIYNHIEQSLSQKQDMNENMNENIERDQKVKITKGTYAGNTAIVHDFDSEKDTASGDDWVDVLIGSKKEKKTVKASELKPINENYAHFRSEAKTRTKPEQLHEAVKLIKKKLQEVDRLVEYTSRLRSEIAEGDTEFKYKTHTTRALEKIQEMIKHTYIKAKKLN